MSHKEIHAIAGEVYCGIAARHGDEPGPPGAWRHGLVPDRRMKPADQRRLGTRPGIVFRRRAHASRRTTPYLWLVLHRLGVEPEPASIDRLVQATACALEQAPD